MKITVSHILVEKKFEAEDLHRRLLRGEDFAELAKKYSVCPSAADGGDLGEVSIRQLDETFAEEAQALKPGEKSGPVRTRFGHHLIWRRG